MNNPFMITIIFFGSATFFVILICLVAVLTLNDKRSGTTDTERHFEQEPIDENDEPVRLVDYIDPDTLEAIEYEIDPNALSAEDKALLDNLIKALHAIFDGAMPDKENPNE